MPGERYDYPLVTVIMPVRDEAATIARAVTAVLCQDYPSECIEIIVADGDSDDQTVEILRRLQGTKRLTVIGNPERLQAAGLNRALRLASGEIVIRVDGHTVIAPDYVRHSVEILRQTRADGVGGALSPVGITRVGRAIAAASRSPFAVPSVYRIASQPQYSDTAYMGAYWRDVLKRVGGYDETFTANEDYELNYRIRKAGGRIFFSPELRSDYYGQQELPALARQYFRYGFWKPKTLRKHPRSLRARHLAAPAFVAFLAGAWLVPGIWLSGVVTYLLATALFSLRAGRQAGDMAKYYLPIVFVTIHAAWGVGFWVGTLDVLLRRQNRANLS